MTASTQAAQTLFNRRQPGVKAPRLAEAMRPKNILEALAIHDEMTKLAAVGGWKCLLPPAEDKIIAAPIFNVQQHSSIVTLFEDNDIARVEPEICFVLGKDLPAKKEGYSEAEIIDAISSAHMALELMQSRFADDAGQSFHESLADCLLNQGVYVGPEIDKTNAINLQSTTINVTQGDDIRVLEGKHPNSRAIDGLIWLVNFMSQRGKGLNANAAIITGSFKGIVNMAFDIETTISYQGIADYTVTFQRA